MRFMSHFTYATFPLEKTLLIASMTNSRTSFRLKSSTRWFLPSECSRLGLTKHQSGCSLYSLLLTFTISGSTQIPKSSPSLFTLSAKPLMPFGSFFELTSQSPSDFVSSSRSPNHPSSMTKSSHPTSAARFARRRSLDSSNLKYAASQLFKRIGRS